jgi:hypothetical protein
MYAGRLTTLATNLLGMPLTDWAAVRHPDGLGGNSLEIEGPSIYRVQFNAYSPWIRDSGCSMLLFIDIVAHTRRCFCRAATKGAFADRRLYDHVVRGGYHRDCSFVITARWAARLRF